MASAPPAATGPATGERPELLAHRLALYSDEQRMVFGANTYRAFARMLASSDLPREGALLHVLAEGDPLVRLSLKP
jgi:hypothetical protein